MTETFVVIVCASVVLGFVVGILSGMLGVGGGTLFVPAFKLGYAMDSIMCTATSLFAIIPTAISGSITHIRNKTCIPKLGVAAGVGGAIMSPVGVWLASNSPEWAIMLAAAVVLVYSSTTMFRKAIKMKKPTHMSGDGDDGMFARLPANANMPSSPSPDMAPASLKPAVSAAMLPETGMREVPCCVAIGLFAGVVSGYVGVGGGFIMVPLFMQLLNIPMKLTSGTSLMAVMILAVPGVITQASMGNVDWMAGIAVACGSIPGALIGAKLTARVPERTLRFIFGGFLLVAAALLIAEQLGIL